MPHGKRRPWKDEDNTTLIGLWDSVGSVALIALMMKRSQSSVQTQASRLGLPPRAEQKGRHRRRWMEKDDAHLDQLMEETRNKKGGIPIQKVADKMGRSVDAVVSRLLTRHGADSALLDKVVVPKITAPPSQSDLNKSFEKKNKERAAAGAKSKKGKVKNCLKCRKSFFSEGNHNWVCSPCKRSDEWDSEWP